MFKGNLVILKGTKYFETIDYVAFSKPRKSQTCRTPIPMS